MAALVFVIFVALAFDFFNGFHDAANEIATVVSTRVLSPRTAVLWAALWHLVAIVLGTKVAATIAKDIVVPTPTEPGKDQTAQQKTGHDVADGQRQDPERD